MVLQLGVVGEPVISGLALLFLWTLVGYGWVDRDATRRGLSSPAWRGVGWGWLGVVGLITHLRDDRPMGGTDLLWLGGSILCFALWGALVVGSNTWPGRAWAAFVAGMYVLYWRFSRNRVDHRETETGDS